MRKESKNNDSTIYACDAADVGTVEPGCTLACLQAEECTGMHRDTAVNAHQRLTEEKESLNKFIIFVFFTHKVCSHSFITLRLNHWCHMDYFNDVLTSAVYHQQSHDTIRIMIQRPRYDTYHDTGLHWISPQKNLVKQLFIKHCIL